MEFSEHVLVLQVGKFREADLWVRFLSPSRGVLSAFAFGGSLSRRRFVGCLDVFNQVHFRVKSSPKTQYLYLQEGVLIQGPDRLRHDWRRFGIARNCANFLQAFGVAREGAAETHALFLDFLRLLEEAEHLPAMLPLLFRLRLAFDLGYGLDMTQCSACAASLAEQGAYFQVRQGRVVCQACARLHGTEGLFLSGQAVAVLTCVQQEPPLSWAGLALAPGVARECARAIDGFIHYHVGLAWENGRFVRS